MSLSVGELGAITFGVPLAYVFNFSAYASCFVKPLAMLKRMPYMENMDILDKRAS